MRESRSLEINGPGEELFLKPSSADIAISIAVPREAQIQLTRMFRDPYVLSEQERADLISSLRTAVEMSPQIAELRVLLGMALCVDLKVQDAMEILREAVRTDPDNFIARLKLGELLMRLRICDEAVKETRQAALLASNPVQSELARRQAATLRTMMRVGVERGGYPGPLKMITGLLRRSAHKERSAGTPLIGQG